MIKKKLARGTAILVIIAFLWFNIGGGQALAVQEDVLMKARQHIREGDYEGALQLLEDYIAKIRLIKEQQKNISEAYYIIAKIYNTIGELELSDANLKLVFETYPEFAIEELDLLFQERVDGIREIVLSSIKQRSDEGPVVVGKVGKPKKKKFPIAIVGGILAAGAIVAVLLMKGNGEPEPPSQVTSGNLEVKSNPTGARIWLNSVDTGRDTDYTFTGKEAGSYSVKLVRENYRDFNTTVNIVTNQTTTVNAVLNLHTITVIKPDSNTKWNKTQLANIEWSVDGSSNSQSSVQLNPLPSTVSGHNKSLTSFLKRNAIRFRSSLLARENRGNKRELIENPRADDVSPNGGYRSKKIARLTERNINIIRNTNNPIQIEKIENIRSNGRNTPTRIIPSPLSQPKETVGSAKIVHPLLLSNVKIQLHKGNDLMMTIVENTSNNGSSGAFQWQEVDPSLSDGSDYKIRILSATDSNVYGESSSFEIGVGDFDEHFDNNTNVNKFWRATFPALWEVNGGVYKQLGQAGNNQRTSSYFNLGDYSDFTFEAKCGNESTTKVWYGLAVRGNEDFSSYYFFYAGNGKYWIKKYDNGQETKLIDQAGHSAINTGTYHWNRLKVVATGKTFTFYINDYQVRQITINDAPYKGRIGLVTRVNYLNVKFDDVSVRVTE